MTVAERKRRSRELQVGAIYAELELVAGAVAELRLALQARVAQAEALALLDQVALHVSAAQLLIPL